MTLKEILEKENIGDCDISFRYDYPENMKVDDEARLYGMFCSYALYRDGKMKFDILEQDVFNFDDEFYRYHWDEKSKVLMVWDKCDWLSG